MRPGLLGSSDPGKMLAQMASAAKPQRAPAKLRPSRDFGASGPNYGSHALSSWGPGSDAASKMAGVLDLARETGRGVIQALERGSAEGSAAKARALKELGGAPPGSPARGYALLAAQTEGLGSGSYAFLRELFPHLPAIAGFGLAGYGAHHALEHARQPNDDGDFR